MDTRPRFDVLGLGCAAVDEMLYVARYPAADSKIHVHRRERHCGGLTATALVAAARAGAKCAFAGTLGYDEGSEFVLETFRREGIDVRHVTRQKNAGPVRSVIVVDESTGTRNIFADVSQVRGAHPANPPSAVIESTRVLFLDYFGMRGNLRAARIAKRAGVAIVSDFEHTNVPGMKTLLPLVNHPIFSRRAAEELTGEAKPSKAAAKLWQSSRAVVIVTCGQGGLWFVSAEPPEPQHFPAFKVDAVDTTGCGDVFHGAYAAALARGLSVQERIRFAAATAAVKATQHGGQRGIPTRRKVETFLNAR
jgi:sulfofructose kinase